MILIRKIASTSSKQSYHLNTIVYLRTTPAVSYERMRRRSRGEEELVTLEYLEDLGRLHDEWLDRVQRANMDDEADMPVSSLKLQSVKQGIIIVIDRYSR